MNGQGRLAGKTAVVTGAASGFGLGIAQCFAREGANILVADRDGDGAERAAGRIRDDGGMAQACEVDVTDAERVFSMYTACESAFKAIDILVANAGLGQKPCRLEDTADQVWDDLFEVNVKGVYHCCRHVIPRFRAQGRGNILITSSGIALRPRPNYAAYGATKAAVTALAKALAEELAPDGIRVNAICPAVGDTPMLMEFMGGDATSEKAEQARQALPLGKLITPEDVGNAAVFLASDAEAGTITGCALPVDSGRCI